MSYKNDVVAQKEVLEKNLVGLNNLLSQKLGIKVHLYIKERKMWTGEIYYELLDDTNLRDLCGVAKYAFEKITIGSWGVYWGDDDVVIKFNYYYTHPGGGSNGTELCTVIIKDDEITFIK